MIFAYSYIQKQQPLLLESIILNTPWTSTTLLHNTEIVFLYYRTRISELDSSELNYVVYENDELQDKIRKTCLQRSFFALDHFHNIRSGGSNIS